jgi:hypothetical protein
MASVDDTGNDARARRITEYAVERGWTMAQAVRYAVAAGYLAAAWPDEEVRTCEAGIVRTFNTPPSTKEVDCYGK